MQIIPAGIFTAEKYQLGKKNSKYYLNNKKCQILNKQRSAINGPNGTTFPCSQIVEREGGAKKRSTKKKSSTITKKKSSTTTKKSLSKKKSTTRK
jgi:hypothetical protein